MKRLILAALAVLGWLNAAHAKPAASAEELAVFFAEPYALVAICGSSRGELKELGDRLIRRLEVAADDAEQARTAKQIFVRQFNAAMRLLPGYVPCPQTAEAH